LCRELNQRDARYIVVGGFAIRAAGYGRQTMDVDLLIATDAANEARFSTRLPRCPTRRCAKSNPARSLNTP
jgi:hypothetical protein